MRMAYVNSEGKTFEFARSNGVKVLDANFHKYSYEYEGTELEYGIRDEKFKKKPYEYQVKLYFYGGANSRAQKMDELHDVAEFDRANKKRGKLIRGDWYTECYIIEQESYSHESQIGVTVKDISFLCPYPFWISEQHINMLPINGAEDVEETAKGYPYGYPYSYANAKKNTNIKIDHYTDSDFRMTVYGPTASVNISINGHPYHVDYPIEAGEYMIIDSRDYLPPDERIYLVRSNGERINVFNYRDPVYSVFKKIPPGNITIYYSRNYGIDLTIFLERSEPKWKK